MERKLLDMMNQLSISEYNPRMEYCDKLQFIKKPFERGEILFQRAFYFTYIRKLQDKAKTSYKVILTNDTRLAMKRQQGVACEKEWCIL